MILISDKTKCSGCGACEAGCPQKAIRLTKDSEGCKYPVVDLDKCSKCNLCDKICPLNASEEKNEPGNERFETEYYAVQLLEKEELLEVSSGGAFWAIVLAVLENKGVVYGAVQESVDSVVHKRAENIEEAKVFRRSKYLQSNLNGIYHNVEEDLKNARTVLFSGTGCQVAALYGYLKNKQYDNLITCEVVCHGVPVGLAWDRYKSETEKLKKKNINSIVFRDKSAGWKNNRYKITYDDGSVEYETSVSQLFHNGYLLGLYYRPSCGKCRFARMPRVADITLADYWRYEGRLLENGDLGVSLVVINSNQGSKVFEFSQKYIEFEKTDKESADASCNHLNHSPKENAKRDVFMEELKKNGFHKATKKVLKKQGIIGRLINTIKG